MNQYFADGGPAFPISDPSTVHGVGSAAVEDITEPGERDRVYIAATTRAARGMSLRDHFAGLAMQGFISGHIAHHGHESVWAYSGIADCAYEVADAMLAQREKGGAL